MELELTPEHKTWRAAGLGGSDANILMSDDRGKIYQLWEVKRGISEGPDLSGILPVAMGSHTEVLNRHWFEKQLGVTVTDAGERRIHQDYDFIRCSLDGMVKIKGELMLWEAKHVGAYNYDLATIVERYQPQLQHCMAVCNVDKAALSVFSGNSKWEWQVVESDPFYQTAILERELAFWRTVEAGTAPPRIEKIEAPDPIAHLTLDLSRDNRWCANAQDFLASQQHIKLADAAKKEMKDMVPADVIKVTGGGIIAKRDKRGSLRFLEAK